MPARPQNRARLDRLVELLEPARRTIVMDIGANPIHVAPYVDLLESGHADVWGFEPQQDAYEQLMARKGEREHYLPHAVGDGGEADLHLCKSGGFASLLRPNTPALDFLGRWHQAMTVERVVPIQTTRLDDMAELPRPDFLKIDVQGAEMVIFRNGRDKLSEAVAVMTEIACVPIYEGQPLFHDQAAILCDYGFLLHNLRSMKTKAIGSALMAGVDWRMHQNQMIDGDAVFIRNLITPETVSDEQLKHLAICADSIFQSHDLALKCLSFLIERGTVSEAGARAYAADVPHQKADRTV